MRTFYSRWPGVSVAALACLAAPVWCAVVVGGEVVASAEELAAAKVGDRRAVDLGGGVKIELCGIPAGKFVMGGEPGLDLGWMVYDEQRHEVTLTKAFWLGRTEVTQAQWEAVMGNNLSKFQGKDLPVETVSWDEATDFCGKFNAKGLLPAGWKWSLPSEAQWEYACRAGTTDEYPRALDEMAWYQNKNCGERTHEVATKTPNAWGLFDMHGNVWEWCADWYGLYPTGAVIDPTGPDNGHERVARGGSWRHSVADCRSAARFACPPGIRSGDLGLRVAAVPLGK